MIRYESQHVLRRRASVCILCVHAREQVLSPQAADVQSLIDAEDMSVITLLSGTFTNLCNITISRDLLLQSRFGSVDTFLDSEDRNRHFRITHSASVTIRGIAFTRGFSTDGGCLVVEQNSTLTISDSVFRECTLRPNIERR